MAAFNFPNSPSTNQTHTENGVTWKWDGEKWIRVEGVGAQGAAGATGPVGLCTAEWNRGSMCGYGGGTCEFIRSIYQVVPGVSSSESQQMSQFMDGGGIEIVGAACGCIGTEIPGSITAEGQAATPGGEISIRRRIPGTSGDTTLSAGAHGVNKGAGSTDLVAA